MREDQPSRTALDISVIRAVHQLIDERPLILEDPISPLLLSNDAIESINTNPNRHRTPQARGLRSHVVLRSRYAEDQLRVAVEAGISQFLSLGAGFDTFSFRQPKWARGLRIVEVDHPASQKAKIERFRCLGIPFPENTEFVPVDLEKNDLAGELRTSNINPGEPIFVACLGVLVYLSRGTIQNILKEIAGMGRGTMLVVAFAPKDSDRRGRKPGTAAEHAATLGEPWLSHFTEEELRNELTTCGFASMDFLGTEEAEQRYYKGRADLPPPRSTRLCTCMT